VGVAGCAFNPWHLIVGTYFCFSLVCHTHSLPLFSLSQVDVSLTWIEQGGSWERRGGAGRGR
jgi:hypothetical protein